MLVKRLDFLEDYSSSPLPMFDLSKILKGIAHVSVNSFIAQLCLFLGRENALQKVKILKSLAEINRTSFSLKRALQKYIEKPDLVQDNSGP